jgi:hypothetical protein
MSQVIAIDFDGVIADTDPAKARFAREELGLELEQRLMTQRSFIDLFGHDRGLPLYSRVIRGVYSSERMLTWVSPVPGACKGVATLQAAGYRCVVVTSRKGDKYRDEDSQVGWAWRFLVFHNFPIEFTDLYNSGGEPKTGICLDVGVQALIDDDYTNLVPVVKAGVRGYLLSTATNSEDEIDLNSVVISRVDNWREFLGQVMTDLGR